jgi:hypothetical protein
MDQQKDNNSLTHWKYIRRIRKGNRYVYFYDTNTEQLNKQATVKQTVKDLESARLATNAKVQAMHDKNIADAEKKYVKAITTLGVPIQDKYDACQEYITKFEQYKKTTAYAAAVKKKGKATVEREYNGAFKVLSKLASILGKTGWG